MKTKAKETGTPSLTPKKRCAIYTRKSTDEGLDMEFNSLEAQRDSALAFISSQRHEGWTANDQGYDDGGFSGGNTNRPSLKRLLADVEDGRIDVVVVYKIDRLSRSLSDFAKIVDLFDAKGVQYKKEPALLNGLLYAPDGQRMLPTFTQKKNGKRYRYYVPYLEKRQSAGATYDPTQPNIGPLPAAEIESAVMDQVHQALQRPEMIVGVWKASMALPQGQRLDEPMVLVAMRQMSAVWENLFPIEQNRIMRLLIERVQLHEDGLDIIWHEDSWQRFCREIGRQPFVTEQQEQLEELV